MTNSREAFLSKGFSISSISKAISDEYHLTVQALLNIIIGDIIQFLNVGKTMNEGQLIETVQLIIKHYGHFKLEDFKLCIEGVKKGNHGPLYDRIDGQVILSWFKAYDQERDYIAAEIASNTNEVYKMQDKTPLLAANIEPTQEKYKALAGKYVPMLRAQLAESKIARDTERKNEQRDRPVDPLVQLHQVWIAQHQKLHEQQRIDKRIRLVRRYGKVMDTNAYLLHKQWQYQLAHLPYEERMNYYLTKYQ